MRMSSTFLIFTFLFGSVLLAQSEPLKVVEHKEKFGFFRGDTKVVDYVYDEVKYRYNSSFAVRKGGYWGLVSDEGEEMIPCTYDLMKYNWGTGYIVSTNGLYGVIDGADSTLLEMAYDNIDYYYKDSVGLVKQEGEWGYLIGSGERFVSDTSVVFKRPQQMPLFDACEEAGPYPDEIKRCSDRKMLTFVYGSLNYPKAAREEGISGMVVINFVVGADGEILRPTITREIGGGCGAEALRVIKAMGKWVPGSQDGKPVATSFNFPVKYQLD